MIEGLFYFWVDSYWGIALVVSFFVNTFIYVVTAYVFSVLFEMFSYNEQGKYITQKPLKDNQVKWEIKFGVMACFIFAVASLATRELYYMIWPQSIYDFLIQAICFIIFYETYSYFMHLCLHNKLFIKYHSVHHRSVRVTPWSAYSVHPVEAAIIGFSAPFFMMLFPFSLSLALLLHVVGMIFTILLHSNFTYQSKNKLLQWISSYPEYAKHHKYGDVNYGFVGGFWDKMLKTKYREL